MNRLLSRRTPFASVTRMHATVLLVVGVVLLVVTYVATETGGGNASGRNAALLVLEICVTVSGIVLHVAWQVRGTPALGWMAAMTLTLGLSELPFLVLSLTDPVMMTGHGAEPAEILASALGMGLALCAMRGLPLGPMSPLTIGVVCASALALFRATQPEWLPLPDGWQDGTAPAHRIVVAVGALILGWALWRTVVETYLRAAFTWLLALGSMMAIGDDSFTADDGTPAAVLAILIALFLGQEMIYASVRALLSALADRMDELSDLAVRAAAAERVAARNGAVLDEVRVALAPLAKTGATLDQRGLTPHERAAYTQALGREVQRVHGLLDNDQPKRPLT